MLCYLIYVTYNVIYYFKAGLQKKKSAIFWNLDAINAVCKAEIEEMKCKLSLCIQKQGGKGGNWGDLMRN